MSNKNKLKELANKLFNMKPNEQIIQTLKGEVIIPHTAISSVHKNVNIK